MVAGANNKGAILVLVERKTGFFFSEYLPYGKNAKKIAEAIINI